MSSASSSYLALYRAVWRLATRRDTDATRLSPNDGPSIHTDNALPVVGPAPTGESGEPELPVVVDFMDLSDPFARTPTQAEWPHLHYPHHRHRPHHEQEQDSSDTGIIIRTLENDLHTLESHVENQSRILRVLQAQIAVGERQLADARAQCEQFKGLCDELDEENYALNMQVARLLEPSSCKKKGSRRREDVDFCDPWVGSGHSDQEEHVARHLVESLSVIEDRGSMTNEERRQSWDWLGDDCRSVWSAHRPHTI